MSIYRSTNPADYDDIDGIVVSESSGPSAVQGAGSGVVILVGQFERGPTNVLKPVGSIGEVLELFGKSDTYKGNIALKNKKFAGLVIVRAAASAAVKASKAFQSSTTDRITFTAKYVGAYGNSIKVTIENGTVSDKKYTVQDTSANAVLPTEVYDNLAITAITSATFAASKLVDVVVNSSAAEPTNAAATALASGADGSIADADYQTAIAAQEIEGAGNVLLLDDCNATRAGYVKTSVSNTQDKIGLVSLGTTDTKSAAITAVASLRDADGRVVYCFNGVYANIGGVSTLTDAASWVASILSQTGPNVDPAYAGNVQYMAGATSLQYNLTRTDYIALKNAGICAFENDSDLGIKPKSGVVTQIADSSKQTIARRRMADYLTQSVSRYLKVYQNAVNSQDNRTSIKAAILGFVQQNEQLGLLPKDSEVKSGKAKLVDTESLNTDTNVGLGFCYIIYKQRIYSSMRFIVLQAQIGETVVVTEH